MNLIHVLSIVAGLGLLAMANPSLPGIRDALLKLSRALPASTTAVTSAAALDLGPQDARGLVPAQELLLTAPLVTTSQLPDSKLMTYDIIMSANSDLSSPTVIAPGILVQTGAGGAGAAAATFRFRPPSNGARYWGFKITPSASGTGDASGATATLEVVV